MLKKNIHFLPAYLFGGLIFIGASVSTNELYKIQRLHVLLDLLFSDFSLHFFGFGGFALLLAWGDYKNESSFPVLRAGVIAGCFGLTIEVYQLFLPYRDFSFKDMGADLAGISKLTYPTNVRIIHVMCTAMLNPSLVFESFFYGADGVLIAGCYPQDCHYQEGFNKATIRYETIKQMLAETGINENRVKITSISAGEGEKFAQIITEFKEELENLGPIRPEEYSKPISRKRERTSSP